VPAVRAPESPGLLRRRKAPEAVPGVTIRILADREPYASFGDQSLPEGDALAFGPPSLDASSPDIIVLPALDFLALTRIRSELPPCIAYGPVTLMGRAFGRGCVDYLREPWSLPELGARLGRFRNCGFRARGQLFRLEGSLLLGEGAAVELKAEDLGLLRLLIRNAPFPVSRAAAVAALSITSLDKDKALRRHIASLRQSLERLSPTGGRDLRSVRGLGYRLEAELCG
jgi:DNA-binding response OmpR family regulator